MGGLPCMRNLRPRRFRIVYLFMVSVRSSPRAVVISHPCAEQAFLDALLALFVWIQTPIPYHSTRR